jgi:hypothetical protein
MAEVEAEIKWNDEVPTIPGYYWAFGLLDLGDPWMVLVFNFQDQLQCTVFGDQDGWALDRYAEDIDFWMGPIKIPKKP